MFVSEKRNPPSIIYTGTGTCGPREAALLKDQGNLYNFGLFVYVCFTLNLKLEIVCLCLIEFTF